MRLRGLRQARQRQGVSLSRLAELADLARERITRYEQGHDDVEPAIIRRLSLVLDVSQRELITGIFAPSQLASVHPQSPVAIPNN